MWEAIIFSSDGERSIGLGTNKKSQVRDWFFVIFRPK